MAQVPVCDIDPELAPLLKKFKSRKEKNVAAIFLKIDSKTKKVVLDEEFEDVTIEELANELPVSQPRYILISYVLKSSDGRVSYPQMFILYSPEGCKTEHNMMFSGTKAAVIAQAGATRNYDIRKSDELTEEYLEEKLKNFR